MQKTLSKKRRLGGWTRVGIIASIVWAVGAWFYWTEHLATVASDAYGFSARICYSIQNSRPQPDYAKCHAEAGQYMDTMMTGRREEPVVLALLPIPFAWLIVYLIVKVWRWVRAGFDRREGTI